jgi:NAD(P)-dependent dehydrogenase (short-subunit alcohol dehydrogenase family)
MCISLSSAIGQKGIGQKGIGQKGIGQTAPGQTVPGQTVPGKTAPGKTAPGTWAWSRVVGIISGATSGIGARTAELFVEEGAKVVFTGRRWPEGDALAKRLVFNARFVAADATLEDDWKRVIAETAKCFGPRLDYVFNNAGGPAPTGSITTIPVEAFDAAMALLVRSVMRGIKHAAPIMIRQGTGSIIDNGSIAGHQSGYSTSMICSAAKAAVNQHLTRCVGMELGEHNVRVNSVSPGPIATGILAKALGMEARKAEAAKAKIAEFYAKAALIPRSGAPDDIAQCVLWLASDRSTFVNATDIVVDGGVLGGRNFAQHHEGLKHVRAALGLS